jgi:2-oxo-3-hexenedioate decarboxylase
MSGVARTTIDAVATDLIAAWEGAHTLPPITATHPGFGVAAAYDVLHTIDTRRREQGWRPVGRKIGFTNRTLWARYGVHQPMWAHVWDRTLHRAIGQRASIRLAGFVQPRIEPEVVFGLRAPVPPDGGVRALLECVDWIAAVFEIVQSHFPAWRFAAPDCTAAFGLHGALVVGAPEALDARRREALAMRLPAFEATLRRGDAIVDRGRGANVLDSPALALRHIAQALAAQPQFPALAAGEIVTTGTLTDAWPVEPGQRWRSDYGALDVAGLEIEFG